VAKFFFLYILSLLAGKFEKIRTAFPLATFLVEKFNRTPFEHFLIAKKFQRVSSTYLSSPKELVVYMEDVKSNMASCEKFDVQE